MQEKETYEEDNHATGFGVSWNVNFFDKTTDKLVAPGSKNAYRKFSMPNIGGSFSKGNIDSHYRSARDQAGFFAGSKGFDIYVEKNTDLKGGVIASEAFTDKNHLSTGTLSFSDLKNEADYSAKSIGASYHKYGNYKNMTEDEQNKVYNTIGLAPNISMPVKGDASSTTKSAVAAGTIDIRENPAISAQIVLENFSFSFGKNKANSAHQKRGRLPSFLVHTILFFLAHHLQFLNDEVLRPEGRFSLARLPIFDSSQGNQEKLGHAFLCQPSRLPGFFYPCAHTTPPFRPSPANSFVTSGYRDNKSNNRHN